MGQGGISGGRTKGTRYPLGHSSSSTSTTTTSSIPSTPSDVLQPTAEGQESATDYDDDWENEDWGSIEDNNSKSNATFDSSPAKRETESSGSTKANSDGWDSWNVEENVNIFTCILDFLEILIEFYFFFQQEKDGWSDKGSNGPQNSEPRNPPPSSTAWSKGNVNNHDEFFASLGCTNKAPNSSKAVDDWNNSDWNAVETNSGDSGVGRSEELKKRREERKLQRQMELEAKRSNKAGPMKLGAKKNLDL